MTVVTGEEILGCENVTVAFDGMTALSECSIRFPHSGIVALMGPNGSGKTTLFTVLTGFVRAQTGCCYIGACDITHLRPFEIARLGISRSFQELRFIRRAVVLENVLLSRPRQRGEQLLSALLRRGVSEEKVNRGLAVDILVALDLGEVSLMEASSLSFGQQKLLALACCVATDARVVLLDEPFAGVAPATMERMVAVLQGLRNEGRLVVIIEHDLPAVRAVADEVIVMSAGKVIWQGAAGGLSENAAIIAAYFS